MLRFGNADDLVIDSDWQEEVNSISPTQVPDPEKRMLLQQALRKLNPRFVAAGHGPCIRL
jgi:hypothetical protein